MYRRVGQVGRFAAVLLLLWQLLPLGGSSCEPPRLQAAGLPAPSIVPKLTLVSSANPGQVGPEITFTATVTTTGITPTGVVSCTVDGVLITTGPRTGGAATFATALAAGNHTIVASYGGDANNQPATSPDFVQVVSQGATSGGSGGGGGATSQEGSSSVVRADSAGSDLFAAVLLPQ